MVKKMKLFVSGGRKGAREAAQAGHVAVIVDALRASATTASLLHYGVREIIVVEGVEQAFAEARKRPGALLAGERGCVKVEGFDLGNSPLQAAPERLSETLVFSSSNMSRCCVGAATCPAAFLGTLPTLSACAEKALAAARQHGRDIMLIPAGAVVDESKLVLEDYVAAGALITRIVEMAAGDAESAGDGGRPAPEGDGDRPAPEGDAARAALDAWAGAQARGLQKTFLETDNGQALIGLGFEEDVRFACRADLFATVPQVQRTYEVDGGELAAVLGRAG
ncbi:MAG: 2-phosphosulfolactate phosphatase [Armatimonadia bacterium]